MTTLIKSDAIAVALLPATNRHNNTINTTPNLIELALFIPAPSLDQNREVFLYDIVPFFCLPVIRMLWLCTHKEAKPATIGRFCFFMPYIMKGFSFTV
jgi:hypothetical protein